MSEEETKPDDGLVPEGWHAVPDYFGRSSGKMRDIREWEPFASHAGKVINARRTMLYYDRLFTIYQAIENVAANLGGLKKRPKLLEIGVYRGGSSYFMTSVSHELIPQRAEVYCVDTFSGHSKSDLQEDLDPGQKTGDFLQTSYEDVKEYLSGYSLATVLQGRIQDFEETFKDMTFDLIHLDVDIYKPTYYALRYFSKRLAPNGIVIVDDYGFITCPGAKKAVDQYVSEFPKIFTKFELLTGQCLLVKKTKRR